MEGNEKQLGNLTFFPWHETNAADCLDRARSLWYGAALFERKELKQQPLCIEEARSRTNRQNTRGPSEPPARFERLPTSSRTYKKGKGTAGIAENYK